MKNGSYLSGKAEEAAPRLRIAQAPSVRLRGRFHENRLLRPRRDAEGERRTNKQMETQAPPRPREASGAMPTRTKHKIGAKGVRGGNLQADLLPPRTLFGTFSRVRKYM